MNKSITINLVNLSSRLYLILGFGMLTLGFILTRASSMREVNDIIEGTLLLGAAFIIIGGTISAFTYLRGNRTKSSYSKGDNYVSTTNKLEDEDLVRIADFLKEHIDSFSVGTQDTTNLDFTDEERKEVIGSIKSNISKELAEDIFKSAKSAIANSVTDNKYFHELKRELKKTKARLAEEIGVLTRRGNLNLVIGGITTVVAVILLGYVVLTADINTLRSASTRESTNLNNFVWHYIPRITLSIFIQIFSFFFLRLYRNSLDDIKYFQNELTNVDSRFAALEAALLLGDKETVSKVIEEISNTDRNSKLNKGESTVALEKLKEENRSLTGMLVLAKDLISSFKK